MKKLSTLTDKLLDIYITYKDDENSPVPLDTIKEYLELEGISLEDVGKIDSQDTDEKIRESIGGAEFE